MTSQYANFVILRESILRLDVDLMGQRVDSRFPDTVKNKQFNTTGIKQTEVNTPKTISKPLKILYNY